MRKCVAASLMMLCLGVHHACGDGRDYGSGDLAGDGSGLTPTGGSGSGTGSGSDSASGSGGTTGGGSGSGSGSSSGDANACSKDAQCPLDQHCEFAPMQTWAAGTQGHCKGPCARNNDCALGQLCLNERCYSQIMCDPNNHNTDCPPDEVCNAQAKRCGAPPRECHFNDQCPIGWSCDMDNVCRDPQHARIGSCTTDPDCNGHVACTNQTCVCTGQTCTPRTCTTTSACGTNNVCISGGCRPTRPCTNQSACTPYSMVCASGHCIPPDPCGAGNTCSVGMTCYTNLTPPSCLPTGSNQCSRDEQCGQGEYCDLFTGICKTGCRSDTDCGNKCGALSGGNQCVCSAAHQCAPGRPGAGGGGTGDGTTGGSCGSVNECPVGTSCAPDDPMDFTCAFDSLLGDTDAGGGSGDPFGGFGDLGLCPKSCHTVCDQALALIIDTCPQGTQCSPPSDVLLDLIDVLLGGDPGASISSTTGFCY